MYKEIDGWRTTQMDMCLKSAKKQGNGNIEDYQHSELMVAMSHCSRIRVAVDIGAHVGLTAFQMAKSFDHVHAFEINPPIYECMVHNLKDRCNNVTTYPVGIGEIEENVDLVTTNKSFSTHIKPGTKSK
jgi:protein-L-isoaspartate O-methyltransferase